MAKYSYKELLAISAGDSRYFSFPTALARHSFATTAGKTSMLYPRKDVCRYKCKSLLGENGNEFLLRVTALPAEGFDGVATGTKKESSESKSPNMLERLFGKK